MDTQMGLLVHQIWAEASVAAQRVLPGFGRRAVTRGLAGAALAIVTDCQAGTAILPRVRSQLTHSWQYAHGDRAKPAQLHAA